MYFISFYNNDDVVFTISLKHQPDFDLVVKSIQKAESNCYLLSITDGEVDLISIDYRKN